MKSWSTCRFRILKYIYRLQVGKLENVFAFFTVQNSNPLRFLAIGISLHIIIEFESLISTILRYIGRCLFWNKNCIIFNIYLWYLFVINCIWIYYIVLILTKYAFKIVWREHYCEWLSSGWNEKNIKLITYID